MGKQDQGFAGVYSGVALLSVAGAQTAFPENFGTCFLRPCCQAFIVDELPLSINSIQISGL